MSNQLTTQQQGWLRLAEIKQNLFTELQNAELSVQGTLSGIEGNTHLGDVQQSIKSAKEVLSDAKSKRLAFTRMIDEKLLTPSMEYEKRMALIIDTAGKHELELRKEEEKKAFEVNALLQEEAQYKAHILNEWYNIAAVYRTMLEVVITNAYKRHLQAQTPLNKIKFEDIITELNNIKITPPKQFNRVRINDARAKEIISESRSYNKNADLEEAIKSLEKRFALYTNDLANAKSAIEQMEIEAKEKEAETKAKLASEQATNILIAQAEVVAIDTPKVKREIKIVIVESEQWAMTVTANFLKNWQYVNKYCRVKSWSKLTIAQMADALAKHIGETGEEIAGLKIEEICK